MMKKMNDEDFYILGIITHSKFGPAYTWYVKNGPHDNKYLHREIKHVFSVTETMISHGSLCILYGKGS